MPPLEPLHYCGRTWNWAKAPPCGGPRQRRLLAGCAGLTGQDRAPRLGSGDALLLYTHELLGAARLEEISGSSSTIHARMPGATRQAHVVRISRTTDVLETPRCLEWRHAPP